MFGHINLTVHIEGLEAKISQAINARNEEIFKAAEQGIEELAKSESFHAQIKGEVQKLVWSKTQEAIRCSIEKAFSGVQDEIDRATSTAIQPIIKKIHESV